MSFGELCKTNTGKKIARNRVALFDAKSCLAEFFKERLNLFNILIVIHLNISQDISLKG